MNDATHLGGLAVANRRIFMTAACGITGMLISGVAALPSEAASPPAAIAPPAAVAPASCVQMGAVGPQRSTTPETAAESALVDELQAIADANLDETAGVAPCSNFAGAQILVVNPSAQLLAQIQTVQAKYAELPVNVVPTKASMNDLMAAEVRIGKQAGRSVSSVSPDPATGGLDVTTPEADGPAAANLVQQITDAATNNGTITIPVKVSASAGILSNFSTPNRVQDVQPYSMSDNLYVPGLAESNCSAGVPIILSGVRRVLTAGHCPGTSDYNDGNLVGTQYTTSYPGNAAYYGDWKLLEGQTYIANAYTGSNTSSTKLNITGALWGVKGPSSQVCSDGAGTAQICRYFVITNRACATLDDGHYTCQLTVVYHDDTGTGSYTDADGAGPGDSGGPIYYSDNNGGLTVAGILKGGGVVNGEYIWWYTQLSGVQYWNSGASVG